METRHAIDWLRQRRWWVALVLVVVAGYSIGKDRALRDNEQASAPTVGVI